MKVLKHKNLMNLLYATLIAFPLFSILGRVIYTQANQNAKDSYSNQLVESQNTLTNYNQFIEGNLYQITSKEYTTTTYEYTPIIRYTNVSINWVDYGANNSLVYNGFRIRTNDNLLQLYSPDSTSATSNLFNVWNITLHSFTFEYLSDDSDNNMPLIDNNTINYWTYINQKLDNAFDYSLKQFVTDNDYGYFDLTSWFSNMFLSNNAQNNLYIHFINWYLNYVLLVSLIWVLFLLIIWFVNFARRLLESSFDKADRLGG